MNEIKLAVIGHKDHGKSTLIGRLLFERKLVKGDPLRAIKRGPRQEGDAALNYAFLLDAFEEERREGLTIDTVTVRFPGERHDYLITDCPGHRELVQNMLTGASGANAALLVVSAKPEEGVGEQTLEHVRLARLLGIGQVVAAITKMDAVGYRRNAFAATKRHIARALEKAGYDPQAVPVVPVSSVDAVNLLTGDRRMAWYRGRPLVPMLERCLRPEKKPGKLPLRLLVQSVFPAGGGAGLAGYVASGKLRVGETVVFQPSGKTAKIDAVTALGEKRRSARAGENVECICRGMVAGDVARGEVASHPGNHPAPSRRFSARMIVFDGSGVAAGTRGTFHFSTVSVPGRIERAAGASPGVRTGVALERDTALETYAAFPPLGRFMFSRNGKIRGAGVVTGISE